MNRTILVSFATLILFTIVATWLFWPHGHSGDNPKEMQVRRDLLNLHLATLLAVKNDRGVFPRSIAQIVEASRRDERLFSKVNEALHRNPGIQYNGSLSQVPERDVSQDTWLFRLVNDSETVQINVAGRVSTAIKQPNGPAGGISGHKILGNLASHLAPKFGLSAAVEQSYYRGGTPARYGASGSVRYDVVVSGQDRILALLDFKFFNASLSKSRAKKLIDFAPEASPGAGKPPVIEIGPGGIRNIGGARRI